MKKYFKGIVVFAVIALLVVGSMLGVSAAKYLRDVVDCDFESTGGAFLAPGDYDGNGTIEEADHNSLKSLILDTNGEDAYSSVYAKDTDAIYSDVNGDGIIDIRDLVLQDENKGADFVTGGAMVLNGNSAYKDELFSNMGTGAEYKIVYTYKSDASVEVKLNGLDGLLADSTETATDGGTGDVTVTRSIKTPLSFEKGNGIELQLVGEGEITDFSVTRVNMDNEIADKATW